MNSIFSVPEPKAQVHYCDHMLSVVRPSVVRPSVVRRLSSLTFHFFDFSSETTEWNLTKLDRKQDLNVFYQVCVFRADRKKQNGHPGPWLAETFLTSPLKLLNGIQRNLTGSKISTSSTNLCCLGRSKNKWPPWPLIGWEFSATPLKPLNGIQWNLTGSKISTSSSKFVFFGPIGKTKWPPWPLIGWDIFNFSSETAEQNSTKVKWKQDLNILYWVCVFRADRKYKMATPVSHWLRLF